MSSSIAFNRYIRFHRQQCKPIHNLQSTSDYVYWPLMSSSDLILLLWPSHMPSAALCPVSSWAALMSSRWYVRRHTGTQCNESWSEIRAHAVSMSSSPDLWWHAQEDMQALTFHDCAFESRDLSKPLTNVYYAPSYMQDCLKSFF
jgi:hypothetical protein